MQMTHEGQAVPRHLPPRIDSTLPPPPPEEPAVELPIAPMDSPHARRRSPDLAAYQLARMLLSWGDAAVVLLTSAAVGVYLGVWKRVGEFSDGGVLALMLCERVDTRGVPWSGNVILNAPRFLESVSVDAPDMMMKTTPREIRAALEESPTRPLFAPRLPEMDGATNEVVRGDLVLTALQALAATEQDVLAMWWHETELHIEGGGYRVIARAIEVAEDDGAGDKGTPVTEQWFEPATIGEIMNARMDARDAASEAFGLCPSRAVR